MTASAAASVGTSVATNSQAIPRCVCGWKNCRTYQKAFREGKHSVFDGVIRVRFGSSNPDAMALKESIDRTLNVRPEKANDWKQGKKTGQEMCKYTIARHHFTEKHIRKYLKEPTTYSFTKPFSVHGAKKYLYAMDPKESYQKDPNGDKFYLQCPNVPKEVVKQSFFSMKEIIDETKKQQQQQQQEEGEEESKTEPTNPALTTDVTNSDIQGHAVHSQGGAASNAAPLDSSVNDHTQGSTKTAGKQRVDEKDSLTVSTVRSNAHELLLQKEEENKRLRTQLEGMQSQLTFLHNLVQQLQEENRRFESQPEQQPAAAIHGESIRRDAGTIASTALSIVSASKSVKSLPREIALDEDDDSSHESPSVFYDGGRSTMSRLSSRMSIAHQSSHSRDSGVGLQGSRHGGAGEYTSNNKLRPGGRSVDVPHEIELETVEGVTSWNGPNSGTSWDGDDNNSKNSNQVHQSNGNGPTNGTRPLHIGVKQGGDSNKSGTYEVQALVVTDPYGEQGEYTGSISHSTGMPHGYGRLAYDRAGRWYEGDWKHGRWTGQGQLSNGDGDFYEGGLKNDHKHGRGIMRFADGRTFEGEYVHGQMIDGKMTYQDGSTYTGMWVDGMRHGRGRCIFTDQSTYEGEFREGEFYGYGKMSWSDGGWYEGEWWNGEMHGHGTEIRPDGSLRHEGQWCKGQPIRK